MQTRDLITLLSKDKPRSFASLGASLTLMLLFAFLLMVGFFFSVLQVRVDINLALTSPYFLLKIAFTFSLMFLAGKQFYQGIFPQKKMSIYGFIFPFVLLLAGIILAQMQASPLINKPLSATKWRECLVLIPALSLCAFFPLLWFAKQGASANPKANGLTLGIFAGGLGASFYAFHCMDDAPLFVFIFYGVALLFMALFGRLIGRFALKW